MPTLIVMKGYKKGIPSQLTWPDAWRGPRVSDGYISGMCTMMETNYKQPRIWTAGLPISPTYNLQLPTGYDGCIRQL